MRAPLLLVWLAAIALVVAGEPPVPDRFDRLGPQPGEWLPDLPMAHLDGRSTFLRQELRGTTLLVTSSFTCPKSRSRYESLKALAERFREHLRVVVIYVIEAHPVVDVCPYKDVVDVTAENQRDSILFRQPVTMEERFSLARGFRDRLHIELPILVDRLENRAWTALGAAPNLALLVGEDGLVHLRQGWYDGAILEGQLRQFFAKRADDGAHERADQEQHMIQQEVDDLPGNESPEYLFGSGNPRGLALLQQHPRLAKYRRMAIRSPSQWLIQLAAQGGHLAHVDALLVAGADATAETGMPSALHLAAANGHLAVVNRLLDAGVPVNLRSWHSTTAVEEAAFAGQNAVVDHLLAVGAQSSLFVAAARGDLAAITAAIVADPSRAFLTDGIARSLVTYASMRGQRAVVDLLLDHHADPGFNADARAETPLHAAARNGHALVIRTLIAGGAAPDVNLYSVGTALHQAVIHRHLDAVVALLESGARVDWHDYTGLTALHCAADAGDTSLVAALLTHGADPRLGTYAAVIPCGPEGELNPLDTPLHLATARHHLAVMKLLIDHPKGGVTLKNFQDETPAHILVPLKRRDQPDARRLATLEMLVVAGIDLAVKDRDGHTVLDRAVLSKDGEATRYLRSINALSSNVAQPSEPPPKSPVADPLGKPALNVGKPSDP